jgi:hypothetical protein
MSEEVVKERSGINKARTDAIQKKAWELADLVLENQTDPENDARLVVFAFLHSLSRGEISSKIIIGTETIWAPADENTIQDQYGS